MTHGWRGPSATSSPRANARASSSRLSSSSASPTPSVRIPSRSSCPVRHPSRPLRLPPPFVLVLRPRSARPSSRFSTYNFRLFFIGQLISNTGNQLTNVALILFVLKLGHSGLAVGALAACQFGPLVVLSAWAGAVADRSDKRRALLVTQGLEMAQSITLAVLAFLPHPPLVLLYALSILGGVLLAFDNPLRRSFVPEMVSKEDLPNAVVLYSTIVALSQVLVRRWRVPSITTVGFGWCFVLDAITYLAVIACLVMMREHELYRQPTASAHRPRSAGGAALRGVGTAPLDQLRNVRADRDLHVQPARRVAAARDRAAPTAPRSRSPCCTPR